MINYYSSQNKIKESKFILDKFLGCDYTQGDFITDYRRSPKSENLIWGINPYLPVMRKGYKCIASFGNNKILGIHPFGDSIVVHAGTKLYKVTKNDDGTYQSTELLINNSSVGMANNKYSKSFEFEGSDGSTKLYIIGGGRYLQYDGINVVDVTSIAYCPTTVIKRTHEGGGANKEAINILSNSQIYTYYVGEKEIEEMFTATSGQTMFELDNSDIRNLSVYKVETIVVTEDDESTVDVNEQETTTYDKPVYDYSYSNGVVTFNEGNTDIVAGCTYKFIYLTWDGETTYPVKSNVTIDYVKSKETILTAETQYTYNSTTGNITFTTAPTGYRGQEGIDSIEVKFHETRTGRTVIEGCSIFDIFGGKNDTRVFLSGNETYPNKDWYSGLYDATYFPDNCYTYIGTNSTKIMGYIKQYNTQMIIKEDNQFEASAYLRQYTIDDDGNETFVIEQGITGIGAISTRSFDYLAGEPLFLTSGGVVGIEGTNVDYRNLCQERSEKINSKLINNGGLEDAFSISYNNKYYLFSRNGFVYVADSRMLYKDDLGRAQYEWFVWTNIRAISGAVFDDRIVFGDESGGLFVFKKDGDENEYIDEGQSGYKWSIVALWETPRLYFGSISNKKVAPHIFTFFNEDIPSRVKITAIADGRDIDLGTYDNTDKLDFMNIDFENFSFNGVFDEDVKYIHSNIQRFTSIKFRFETDITKKDENDNEENLGFGLKLLQVNYFNL